MDILNSILKRSRNRLFAALALGQALGG